MKSYHSGEGWEIFCGDCVDTMRVAMADCSVDAVITDPPYELGFMGKGWDKSGIANDVNVWREALRVLKPGGHLLAFSGSRTYHRMVCAIEDAEFEIRDQIMWVYGSGFPKSHNLDGDWEGWGTALKPAHEPIVLARKPLIGTVAANVTQHRTGALNVDGCRVPIDIQADASQLRTMQRSQREGDDGWGMSTVTGDAPQVVRPEGRWPANFIHDGSDEVLALFPDSKGQQGDVRGTEPSKTGGDGTNCYGEYSRIASAKRGDTGSAARFFYCAKANKKDRNEGCEHIAAQQYSHDGRDTPIDNAYQRNSSSSNHHPTVKPTDLMRYLCRLVTPPGGVILDPFTGSGSTGKAARLEGFRFVGCELSEEYVEIAMARILAVTP